MYAIIKRIDDEHFNIASEPGTGEPYLFDDVLEANEFAEKYGFVGSDVEIEDIDESRLEKG